MAWYWTCNNKPLPDPKNNPALMLIVITHPHSVSTLRLRQNHCHFPDNIFKYIFFNENVWISIKISMKFVSKGPINNFAALIQIMSWQQPGGNPLSEPMMVSLLMRICVIQSQWVKDMEYSNVKQFIMHILIWFLIYTPKIVSKDLKFVFLHAWITLE